MLVHNALTEHQTILNTYNSVLLLSFPNIVQTQFVQSWVSMLLCDFFRQQKCFLNPDMHKCHQAHLTNCYEIEEIKQLTACIGLGMTKTLTHYTPTSGNLTTSEVEPHPVSRF